MSNDTLTISLFDSRTETVVESLLASQVIICLPFFAPMMLTVFRLTCRCVRGNKCVESWASAVFDINIVPTVLTDAGTYTRLVACPPVMGERKYCTGRNESYPRGSPRARHSHRHSASLCRRRGSARLHTRRGGARTDPADDQPSGETTGGTRRSAVVQEGRPIRTVARGGRLLRLWKAPAATARRHAGRTWPQRVEPCDADRHAERIRPHSDAATQ